MMWESTYFLHMDALSNKKLAVAVLRISNFSGTVAAPYAFPSPDRGADIGLVADACKKIKLLGLYLTNIDDRLFVKQ